MPRESAIQRAIMRWLKGVPNCEARVHHGSAWSVTGDPDIYGCINGRLFLIETKQPGKHLRKVQDKRRRDWVKAGAIAGPAHSLDEAKQLLKPLTTKENET